MVFGALSDREGDEGVPLLDRTQVLGRTQLRSKRSRFITFTQA